MQGQVTSCAGAINRVGKFVRVKCNSACESSLVPFILKAVESICLLVIPVSFRARDLAFPRPLQCAELLPGVKPCNREGV